MYLTIKETAEHYNLSVRTITRLIKAGKFKYEKFDKSVRIWVDDAVPDKLLANVFKDFANDIADTSTMIVEGNYEIEFNVPKLESNVNRYVQIMRGMLNFRNEKGVR